jgi:hypothetical protein
MRSVVGLLHMHLFQVDRPTDEAPCADNQRGIVQPSSKEILQRTPELPDMTDRTLRLDLNQPFEFREAVLSQMDRSRLARGSSARQLFHADPERLVVKDYRLREISIRLRTINNACDSMASLPDGTPLTEVSIYGSRDRQYVLGPYSAVRNLMTGKLPDHSPYDVDDHPTRAAKAVIDRAVAGLDAYINKVEAGSRVQQIHLTGLISTSYRVNVLTVLRHELPPIDEGKFGRMVQLWSEDLEFLKQARSRIEALRIEIPDPPQSPEPPANWWEPMPSFPGYAEYRANAVIRVAMAVREVLCALEEQVYAPG